MLESRENNEISVIIVEDDPMVMRINENFLRQVKDFRLIGSCGKIDEAKEQILKHKPNLLLLDIFFPDCNGIELLKWIRSKNIGTDVIFITADHSSDSISEALRYGAIDYLIKPFRFERFEEALLKYKKMYIGLGSKKSMSQTIVDEILSSSQEAKLAVNEYNLDQGEKNQTYKNIKQFLQKNFSASYTSQEIAERLGISRITARRYLDNMEKEGVVELVLVYGKVGRPLNCYRIKKDISKGGN